MCQSVPSPKKKHTLVEILDRYWDDYFMGKDRRLYLGEKHLRAVNKMRSCRSSRLGIRKFVCESCEGFIIYIEVVNTVFVIVVG